MFPYLVLAEKVKQNGTRKVQKKKNMKWVFRKDVSAQKKIFCQSEIANAAYRQALY